MYVGHVHVRRICMYTKSQLLICKLLAQGNIPTKLVSDFKKFHHHFSPDYDADQLENTPTNVLKGIKSTHWNMQSPLKARHAASTALASSLCCFRPSVTAM